MLDYASGAMPLAPQLAVSAHLDSCASCRADVGLFEELGAQLVAALPDAPLETGALGRAILAIDRMHSEGAVTDSPVTRMADLPLPNSLAAVGLHRRRWLAPGMWAAKAKTPEVDGWRTFLVCLPAGARIPLHCHHGGELVCVLKGSYNDGEGWRQVGDFAQAEGDTEHEIRISADGPCISLISTQAPIKWRGWAKLLHPILGL